MKEGEAGKLVVVQAASLGFRFYGFEEVRHELKAAPRMAVHFSENLRADLLRLYEEVIAKEYSFEQKMMDFAVEYYSAYRSFGGGISHKDIVTDFLIVACASLKEVDIVVSQDSGSMLNVYAKRAYSEVNSRHSLAVPKLWAYEAFRKEIGKEAKLNEQR